MHAPSLRIIVQRTTMDCSVACLAMLCGVEYEAALNAFHHNVCAKGSTIRQIQQASKRLGFPLYWTRKLGELDTQTGLLSVRSEKWKADHLVVLKEGQIVDTDATLWDQDVFLSAYKVKPLSILTFKEDE